jgi:hypothetical protein
MGGELHPSPSPNRAKNPPGDLRKLDAYVGKSQEHV